MYYFISRCSFISYKVYIKINIILNVRKKLTFWVIFYENLKLFYKKRDGLRNIIKLGTTSIEEWSKFKDELINITDEAGNVYYGDVGGIVQGSDWFKMRYDINKNMLDKKLFLNIKIDEQQHSIELVKTTK